MDAAFSSIAFAHPDRAETNLRLVEQRLPAGAWTRLATLLAQVPDPDESLNDFERYLRELPPALLGYLEKQPAAMHYLLLIFSLSRFLSETLIQQPELIRWLHRPGTGDRRGGGDRLERLRTPEDLREELARFRATHLDLGPSVVLARFKRREYLRIMLRDALGLATLAETTLELSHLADVLLETALSQSGQRLEKAYGYPEYTDDAGHVRPSRLVVLSLGKLGGQELNYSSDVDLQFLYEADGQTSGGEAGPVPNAEFFARLVTATLGVIAQPTPEGAVFRVDLRLRPEGTRGDVAVSLAAALRYYRTRARQWELQMLIKCRPSAGDRELGRRFLREVQPLVFGAESRAEGIAAALEARRERDRESRLRRGRGAASNVKLSPGGIRDIEFLAQVLQRVYGAGEAWLGSWATGSTLVALQRLHDKGHLSGRDFFRLSAAYQFFRNVEHRLQLRDGLQVHTLPGAAADLDWLARCLGIEPAGARSAGQQLLARIQQHFAEVGGIYQRLLERRQEPAEFPPAHPGEGAQPLFRQFARAHPAIARAAEEAGQGRDGAAASGRGFRQFLSAALLDPALLARLEAHPEWVRSAIRLAERSDLVAAMLARHPEEIEAAIEASPVRLEQALAEASLAAAGPEGDLDGLRIAHRRALVALAARSAGGLSRPFETFAGLTRLADLTLKGALQSVVRRVVPGADADRAPFAVLALGRLGSQEMDFGSDADLVFVIDDHLEVEERPPWRRAAERFVNTVSSHTRQGLLYPVDARLRPRGAEGEMIQPASYLEQYCRSEAAGWEAVTFYKSRPLAGNPALGGGVLQRIHRHLRERFGTPEGAARLRGELAHMRDLLERQWRARPGHAGLKAAPGGYHDLEYILGYLIVTGGLEPGARTLLDQIRLLAEAGTLDADAAQTLGAAATLYRSVDHALRMVTGLPGERPLDPFTVRRISVLLEEWGVAEADRFPASIDERRRQVRLLYETLVGAG
ncbi:MAG TPA: hypothetical protein VGS20_01445 [Candidatus Acidoferrales bacterium]|nr:hypothetical protein [Candidatus Acidoferrales bacterium]